MIKYDKMINLFIKQLFYDYSFLFNKITYLIQQQSVRQQNKQNQLSVKIDIVKIVRQQNDQSVNQLCLGLEENQLINSQNRMIKNRKVQRLILENDIQRDNYTLVLRLKKIVQQLKLKINDQQKTIEYFKRDVKTTKINQMEIQIQHLNDQNKRLLLLLDQVKTKNKTVSILSPKKTFYNTMKCEQRKYLVTETKHETKIYDLLKQNEQLKKELLNLKINQNLLIKKRKSTLNDRSSIFIEKNLIDYQKLNQKKLDLQAERVVMADKIKKLQTKISDISKRNEELQRIHHHHLQISAPYQ